MKKTCSALATSIFLCTQAMAADLALVNGEIFDATGAEPFTASLVIENGRIIAINRDGSVPEDTPVIDVAGMSVLPGFFDLHTHFTPGGEPATMPQIASAYLAAGVTTVLDFHQAPEAYAPRRAWESTIPTPHIMLIGRTSTTNGHGADWSDTTTTKWVNTPFAATQAITELVPYKPDAIKAFTDGWRYGSGVDNTSMNEPTLTALVSAAHEHQLPVLTHTVTAERAGIAGRSGVDVIAHSIQDELLDEETVADILAGGTSYAATLAVYYPDKPGRPPASPERWARYHLAESNIKLLHEAGVTIALGTDAGMTGTPHGESTLREMELMVGAGLSPAEALLAGTRNSAKAVYLLDERGTIETGKLADLVVIDGKPWEDISSIRNTAYTFVAGEKLFSSDHPQMMLSAFPEPVIPETAMIDDFERSDGRTAMDTLLAGAPDGGMERSPQIIQHLPESGRGQVLMLTSSLALRDDAQAGVILPLSQGSITPVDASAWQGISADIRSDTDMVTLQIRSTGGMWETAVNTGEAWETVQVPFSSLAPSSPEQEWDSGELLEVRFLLQQPGGDSVWLSLDDVAFY